MGGAVSWGRADGGTDAQDVDCPGRGGARRGRRRSGWSVAKHQPAAQATGMHAMDAITARAEAMAAAAIAATTAAATWPTTAGPARPTTTAVAPPAGTTRGRHDHDRDFHGGHDRDLFHDGHDYYYDGDYYDGYYGCGYYGCGYPQRVLRRVRPLLRRLRLQLRVPLRPALRRGERSELAVLQPDPQRTGGPEPRLPVRPELSVLAPVSQGPPAPGTTRARPDCRGAHRRVRREQRERGQQRRGQRRRPIRR